MTLTVSINFRENMKNVGTSEATEEHSTGEAWWLNNFSTFFLNYYISLLSKLLCFYFLQTDICVYFFLTSGSFQSCAFGAKTPCTKFSLTLFFYCSKHRWHAVWHGGMSDKGQNVKQECLKTGSAGVPVKVWGLYRVMRPLKGELIFWVRVFKSFLRLLVIFYVK